MPTPPDGLSHAARLVHDQDRDRFVTALFAPPQRREALMTLYAFNVEIARVQESVREPMAGHIRLQWWRDYLAAAALGEATDQHPIARPLGDLLRAGLLDAEQVERLISARQDDLDGVAPASLAEAEEHAGRSSGALCRLAASLLGGEGGEAAERVGVAWGLVGAIRALGYHLSLGKLSIPAELLRSQGMEAEDLLGGRASTTQLTELTRPLVERARHHLAQARKSRAGRAAIPALLPAILADGYIQVIEKAGYNPFDSRISMPCRRPLRLAMAHWMGRF